MGFFSDLVGDIPFVGPIVNTLFGDDSPDYGSMFKDVFGAISGPATAYAGYQGQQDVNQTNERIAQQNNAFNAEQAATNREFQVQGQLRNQAWVDSNTNYAHQREVNDLRAAGLNPMLGIMKGSGGAHSLGGSGTPGSQASSSGLPNISNPIIAGATAASMGANSALTAQQTKTEGERTKLTAAEATTQTLRAVNAAEILGKEFDLKERQIDLLKGELVQLGKQGKLTDANTAVQHVRAILLRLDIPEARAMADYFGTAWGRSRPYQRDVGAAVGSLTHSLGTAAQSRSALSNASQRTRYNDYVIEGK